MPVIPDAPYPAAQLARTPSDLVFVAWIQTIAGLTADGVGTQLPADETTWSDGGYIVIPTTIGGSPHTTMPMRRPVGQVNCWANNPGSDALPWGTANDLAEQVRLGTYDRLNFGRNLAVSLGGVQYPGAQVRSALMLTEPHRIWSDAGDYAGVSFNLQLQWVQDGEVIP